MKLITRDTDYAIRALSYIAKKNDQIVTVEELVNSLHIPRPFLRKLLQLLNKKKILCSYKGKGGGFVLSVSADKIFLMDLIKIFQRPLQLNECFFKKEICPNRGTCPLRSKIKSIEKKLFSELSTITIGSLLKK